MTDKKMGVMLQFWYDALTRCCEWEKRPVSAATVAEEVGQSRKTAVKWLTLLAEGKSAVISSGQHTNGLLCKWYSPVGMDE